MKFISLAVMALLGTTQGINLKELDMETDEQIGAEVNTQVAAEQGQAPEASPEDAAAAAGVDP
jgi:hypothetical protein